MLPYANLRDARNSVRRRISTHGGPCGRSAARTYSTSARLASTRAENSGRMSLRVGTGRAGGARVLSSVGGDGYFTNGLGGGVGGRR
jgi:hypothetical protein